ncbi:hypothetical protein [Nostoc sp.]
MKIVEAAEKNQESAIAPPMPGANALSINSKPEKFPNRNSGS